MKEWFLRKDGKPDYCSYAPDVIFGIDLGYSCCRLHDKNYDNPESDIELRNNIRKQFDLNNKHLLGLLVSNIYFVAVWTFRRIFYRQTLK